MIDVLNWMLVTGCWIIQLAYLKIFSVIKPYPVSSIKYPVSKKAILNTQNSFI